MSFVDVEFFFFLPAVFVVYWLLPRRADWQNGWLLLCSWAFYAAWDWRWLPLLWAGTFIDYHLSRYIERQGAEPSSGKRAALTLSLLWNFGALLYFKYANFFIQSAHDLLAALGVELAAPVLKLALPLGISFYTLQRVAYVIDVYWGREKACRSPLQFATFCSYFPQLTAGPIARSSELLETLGKARALTPDWIARGAAAFLLGYALKGWVGDTLGSLVVDPVFANAREWSAASHWLALIAYACQVFGDFAGYSLMAIGSSRLFGIELPANFNYPFLSRSLNEFWRRWHITLNRWLFDYIYTPLTTSNGWFRGRMDVALLLTFLASGLWHGAALTFVVWGLIHAAGMIAHRRWDETYRGWCRKDRRFVNWRKSAGYAVAAWLLTQLVFLFSLVPFRSANLGASLDFARGLLGTGGGRTMDLSVLNLGNVALCIAFVIVHHVLGTARAGSVMQRFAAAPAPVRGAAYGLAIVYLALFVPVGAGTFIYQQF